METMSAFEFVKHHADGVAASVAGVGTTISLAASQPLDPDQAHTWLSYIPTIVGPALVVIANRLLAARAARKRAMAEYHDAEAKRKETDADPSNDAEAPKDRLEAAQLRAEADALESLRRPE